MPLVFDTSRHSARCVGKIEQAPATTSRQGYGSGARDALSRRHMHVCALRNPYEQV